MILLSPLEQAQLVLARLREREPHMAFTLCCTEDGWRAAFYLCRPGDCADLNPSAEARESAEAAIFASMGDVRLWASWVFETPLFDAAPAIHVRIAMAAEQEGNGPAGPGAASPEGYAEDTVRQASGRAADPSDGPAGS